MAPLLTTQLPPQSGESAQRAQDYQMWFCRDYEKTPGLLQEREHPYDIIMRNSLNTFSRRESRNVTAFPALPGLYVEQPDIQGRFILKPREAARSQKQSDTEEPRAKKRRPFKSRLFHRGSVLHQDQLCTALPAAKPGKLFGNDLTAICEDGNLPTAILDILAFISEKGPVTEGIFRTSGDIRAFRALKERLDSGTEVNLNNESVPVVASILKISLVGFLTENYPKIFGEGHPVHHESPSVYSDGENTYNAFTTQTDKIVMEENECEEDPCPRGNSVEHMKTTFMNLMITLSSDASKDNVCLTPPVPTEEYPIQSFHTPPAPIEENLIGSTDTLSPPPNEEHL
ncbi:hypothetical protein U0070_013058 [Myodes glareolus]|uniref:Rho-GAP domain-containing protein n=1 Tax=Myodes glareolus TaxID=447135 RepID=A0AAW0IVS9_MYOGA